MAENCTRAFGRYLKTLRERCGFSLYDVCSLSQTFPEKINKGYLSRCENGHQKLAFPKVIALSRIYQVPADVLLERMELDLELDRVSGPDTDNRSYSELATLGQEAIKGGFRWDAYAYFRDAVTLANSAPVRPSFRDGREQMAIAEMNCGSAAKTLGRVRFALYEFRLLESSNSLSSKYRPIILERIAGCYKALKKFPLAESYADSAIADAQEHGDKEYLGHFYNTRGQLALVQSRTAAAAAYYERAHKVFTEVGRQAECAITLINLAQCYFTMKRYRAARRASEASKGKAAALALHRLSALNEIILGEIDEREGKPIQAISRWKEAVSIAKRLNDRELRFKSEFVRFRHALSQGQHAVARAIHRRLARLSPWMPGDVDELDAFKALASQHESVLQRKVSNPQQAHRPLDN